MRLGYLILEQSLIWRKYNMETGPTIRGFEAVTQVQASRCAGKAWEGALILWRVLNDGGW